jgi:phosphatidylserine/phosphatidylglycerophosphate/cardiolipin synthase-like enzyme
MKTVRNSILAAVIFLLGVGAGYVTAGRITVGNFHVFYSLDRRANDREVIRLIDAADTYAYFGIYEFTKRDIADALLRAKARGVSVRGILDRGQSEDGAQAAIVANLKDAGIPIEFQRHTRGIMHLKLIVTDHAYALGSYNWTSAATLLNDEVLEVGDAEPLREQYLDILKKVLAENQ